MLPVEELVLPTGVSIGRHTFGHGVDTFQLFRPGARIEVGGFCCIQREARILAGSEHFTDRVSTFPFSARIFDPQAGNLDESIDRGPTVIGNDVWIGMGAIVLSSVLVGDGAVIAAGAIVSKAVPAYAVVAGNPAQIVRYRFEKDVRERLLALRWWDWSDEALMRERLFLSADVHEFLEHTESRYEPRPPSELMRSLQALSPERLTPARALV
jgi:acetyltransferase-like isoleucine patch superfamily enzyme